MPLSEQTFHKMFGKTRRFIHLPLLIFVRTFPRQVPHQPQFGKAAFPCLYDKYLDSEWSEKTLPRSHFSKIELVGVVEEYLNLDDYPVRQDEYVEKMQKKVKSVMQVCTTHDDNEYYMMMTGYFKHARKLERWSKTYAQRLKEEKYKMCERRQKE
jgi:hypothetical protein